MSEISDRVAYLKGYADAKKLKDSKNGKILREIIDILGDIAEELDLQEEVNNDVSDSIDDIYDMLSADEEFDPEDEEDDGEEQPDDFLEVVCPNCGETIYFDEEMVDSDDGLICPYCNEPVELDICTRESCEGCEEECSSKEE